MAEKKETQNVEKDIKINIDNTDNTIKWLEKFLVLLKEYGPIKILFSTLLIAVISMFFYFIFNPTVILDIYDGIKERQHNELMEKRLDMAPQIQGIIDKLTYKVNASRVVVLEMHNGSTGSGGLPFTKCSATYEGLNIGVIPVAQQYQEQNLSLIPFANHLFNKGYWCGDTEELLELDKALYYKMKSNNTEHFAACVVKGVEKPLAFMIVSFEQLPDDKHKCNEIREYMRHVSMELAVYIEVNNRTYKK